MTTLDKLEEQTQFILTKQLETKKYFLDVFKDFLSTILEEKANFEKAGQKSKVAKLGEIHELAAVQMDRVEEELDKDIEYLEGNLEAVGKIKKEKDVAKRNELVNLILEDQELPETAQLKIDVEAEIESSKEEFTFLLGDLKAALLEGEIDNVLESLKSMESGMSLTDEEEDEEEGTDIFNLPSRNKSEDDEDEDEDDEDFDDYEDDEDYEDEDDEEECDDEDECCDEDEDEDECCRKSSCSNDEDEEEENCCGSFPKKGLSGCCRKE